MAQWINLSEQQICGSMLKFFVVRKSWAYPPTASRSCGRQKGMLGYEIQLDFKFSMAKTTLFTFLLRLILFQCYSSVTNVF